MQLSLFAIAKHPHQHCGDMHHQYGQHPFTLQAILIVSMHQEGMPSPGEIPKYVSMSLYLWLNCLCIQNCVWLDL